MARHQSKAPGRAAAARATQSVEDTAAQAREATEIMQDVMDRTGEQVREGMQQGMTAGSRQFVALGEQAFDTWMRTSNEALQRVLELNVELASWGREQLDDSIGAVRSLSQCRSLGDAYGIQLGLMRSSMEKSLRHANNVFSLSARAMAAGTRAAQQQGQD
jgi:hypothetical protein